MSELNNTSRHSLAYTSESHKVGIRVLVCGNRNWTSQDYINGVLDSIHDNRGPIRLVVEGEARGADLMGRKWAENRGIPVAPFTANWKEHGRAAGPIRNRKQFDEGHPDLVVAFHNDLDHSKGTRDMVRYARSKGCPVEVYSYAYGEVRT